MFDALLGLFQDDECIENATKIAEISSRGNAAGMKAVNDRHRASFGQL
jgi:hypothetical protein